MSQLELIPAPIHISPQGEVEEWRTVPGFIRYEVSSLGRFRRKVTQKLIGGTTVHNGYLHVGLLLNGKQVFKLAHRVVAEAFLIRPSPVHCVVNHLNCVRNDNRVSNLEWATRSRNSKHGWAHKHASL